jgi:hypothetical protein
MTFLMFVFSLAVVGSILKRAGTPRPDAKDQWAKDFYARHRMPATVPQTASPVETAGLAALERALERHGRGEFPMAPKPAAPARGEVVR